MIKNYFKIAWRTLLRNKGYSLINILGLAVGMAVATVIGLWMYDELSFDRSFKDHSRIAQVFQNQNFNGEIGTGNYMPRPLEEELKTTYKSEFKHVVMASWTDAHVLASGEKKISKSGNFMQPGITDMLDLKMIYGSKTALEDPNSILLSRSVCEALFGASDPTGRSVMLDKKLTVKIGGVYENLPQNTSFKDLDFIAPWDLYVSSQSWVQEAKNQWTNNSFQTFVQIHDQAEMDKISAKIRDVKFSKVDAEEKKFKSQMFLFPMDRWHLYGEFKNGKNTGGRIQFVWLFGVIGLFVLLLACINFMNLSTARSERRAKEVGIRKTIGSLRSQLIGQFFSESLLVAVMAFFVSLLLVQLSMPFFNDISGKSVGVLWSNILFWLVSVGFIVFTGVVAGSYPALYLSSFQPVKVLKGTFKAGRFASLPRKVLVVVQFSVSMILIIGTIIVFRQIQFTKDRPIGYDRSGLIMISLNTDDVNTHYNSFREDLLSTGVIKEVAASQGPVTRLWSTNSGFKWKDKDPEQTVDFVTSSVSHEFGNTVGWKFVDGRDFSKAMTTDSQAVVINEAAVKYMGLKNPVGQTITWDDRPIHIIGVIKNMVMESPYKTPRATVFYLAPSANANFITIKLKEGIKVKTAIEKIGEVFKRYSPAVPFDYKFVDEEYAAKFESEERIGKLSTLFAGLAIFISCLGLFGMASFTAEQRTKEIGVRKVLGASVADIWKILSTEFVMLVIIAFLIASPVALYFLRHWLENYEYRTEISWWIFAASAAGAMGVTLITVSFQALKAALTNPVKSLRSE